MILITDTDAQLLEFDTQNYPNLICKRIVNEMSSKTTKLVNIKSNPKTPKTEIEDALDGKLFHEVLLQLKDLYIDQLDFINSDSIVGEEPSQIALDLRSSEMEKLNAFFDIDDNKCEFAKKIF